MKKFTRLLSATIIAIMTMCLCSFGVSAAVTVNNNPYQIVIKNSSTSMSIDGQTFSAYKILSASVGGDAYTYGFDDKCVKTDGNYGMNVTVDYTTPAKIVEAIGTGTGSESNARAFADYVYNTYIKDKGVAVAASERAVGETVTLDISSKGPGYYLVVGQSTDNSNSGSVITSLAMLGTSSNEKGVEIDLKASIPTIVDKLVREKNVPEEVWTDITDAEIGETVEFRIQSTVPDFNGYSTYTYKIEDILSAGLSYVENSAAVYSDAGCTQQISITPSVDASSSTIIFDLSNGITNTGLTANSPIYLKYEATVNSSAKYAVKDTDDPNFNNNQAKVVYSNNPYDSNSTASSVIKSAYVYTYGVEIDKIQPDNSPGAFKALAGAKFKIKKGDQDLTFTSVGTTDNPVYRLDSTGTAELTGDSDGKFIVYGLDAATTYTLVETSAPAGYAQLDKAIPFKILATYNNGSVDDQIATLSVAQDGTSLSAEEVGFSVSPDPMLIKVINKAAGGQLIGTGGMGTTIFYVCGGIMMAGAVILLFTKIRMGNKD